MAQIQTGIDKLVELVNKKKKISIQDAAKELGVSAVVVEEWANFLEEEGLASIEYNLATPYLVERKLTKKEIESKSVQFESKKDNFVRKAESAIASIEKETDGLESFKKEYKELVDTMGSSMGLVKKELDDLREFEKLKNGIDSKMIEQQHKFIETVKDADRDIAIEQAKYNQLLQNIKQENYEIEKEKQQTKSLEDQEIILKKKLVELNDLISKVHEKIEEEDKHVFLTKDHIKQLEKLSNSIKEEMQEKKESIEKLFKESKSKEEDIIKVQQSVINKISKSKSSLKEDEKKAKDAGNKLEKFFSKKNEIETLIKNIEVEKYNLKRELDELIKKAIILNLSKNQDMKKHVTELESKMKDIENKRTFLKKQFEKLGNILK